MSKKNILIILLILIVSISGGVGFFMYKKYFSYNYTIKQKVRACKSIDGYQSYWAYCTTNMRCLLDPSIEYLILKKFDCTYLQKGTKFKFLESIHVKDGQLAKIQTENSEIYYTPRYIPSLKKVKDPK